MSEQTRAADGRAPLPAREAFAGAVGRVGLLVIVAQTVHRFVVSPLYNAKVVPYLTYLSENTATPTSQLAQPLPAADSPGFVG